MLENSFIVKLFQEIHQLGLFKIFIGVLEILTIIAVVIYIYRRFIVGTHSEKLVRGIFVIILMWVFGQFLVNLRLQILGVFLKGISSVIAFGLVVVFQPELRRFIGYLGQSSFLNFKFFDKKDAHTYKEINIVKEIIETIKYLSKNRIGALLVLQKDGLNRAFSEVGTKLNADISQELLLTIFHPNTPLHDGAVIIAHDKVLAAGVLLPLTEDPKLSWRYGTRHRAAIGMSEVSDSACIVVSEETGDVSMAIEGVLKKYEDISQLKLDLKKIYGYKNNEEDAKKPKERLVKSIEES